MPTRRSNRLRAASAASPETSTPQAVVSPEGMSLAEPTAAPLSRRARRLSQSGVIQASANSPVVDPGAVVTDPVVDAVEPVHDLAEPAVVLSEIAIDVPHDHAHDEGATPAAAEYSAADYSAAVADAAASDVDPFTVASEAFGFAPVDDEIHPDVSDVVQIGSSAPEQQHVAPRRSRVLRRVAAAGASFGIMGVAGLIAVSMTLPVSAVAASQGSPVPVAASLVTPAAGVSAAQKGATGEIQAFVASEGVQDEGLARGDSFSTVSLAEVAEEEGIRFSNSLYTNDPDAAIQWPFVVGVAMSSPYGERWGRLHAGIDLVPGNGATIQAIADGVVREATESGGAYGVTVYIDHVIDGKVVTSHYAHMQHGSLQVKTGQKVKVGDPIGKVGNTGRSYGAHLHFEIIINGTTVDPLPWMRENAGRYEY